MYICTVQFDSDHLTADYAELLEVFKKSIRKNMPHAKLFEIKIAEPPKEEYKPYFMTYNTVKLEAWVNFLKVVKESGHPENIIFADCDMLLLQDASHAFDIPFDVAYTARDIIYKSPLNGGIMFARPTAAAIEYFEKLLEINNRMYEDEMFHKPYLEKYVGMNQAAQGYLLEHPEEHNAVVHKFMTTQWNAVEGDWQRINGETVFVHFKGKLRLAVQKRHYPSGTHKRALELWYSIAGLDTDEFLKRYQHDRPARMPKPKVCRRRRIRRKIS